MEGPAGPFAILGKSEMAIKRNIIEPMSQVLGNYMYFYSGKREIDICGRKMYVIGANDERAETKIRGATFSGALVDEATILPQSVFKMLLSRLSVAGARLYATTNPDSPYHWLKTDFIDRKDELGINVWNFNMEDNPSLTDEFKQQIKREYVGLWYQRFIEGKWVQAEGAIYDFFDEHIHTITIPPSRAERYIVGVDYGTTNPTAFVLIGINHRVYPNVWMEKEYFFNSRKENRQKTDSEYAYDLARFIDGYNPQAIYLDPSAASFKLELRKSGIQNIFDAKNDVLDGIRFVSKMMANGTYKICKNCKNAIQEKQTYVWDAKSIKNGEDKPLKENDHVSDAERYALYTHLFGSEINALTAQEIDKIYRETRGESNLPAFFRDPMNQNSYF